MNTTATNTTNNNVTSLLVIMFYLYFFNLEFSFLHQISIVVEVGLGGSGICMLSGSRGDCIVSIKMRAATLWAA